MFLKVTFFHTSARGHTRYKSCGTCHLLSFPLVHTHVGERLFLFSTHCFLLLVAVLRGKKSFSAEYKINLKRLSLVFVYVMYKMVSFSSLCWLHNVASLLSLQLLSSLSSSMNWQKWLCGLVRSVATRNNRMGCVWGTEEDARAVMSAEVSKEWE